MNRLIYAALFYGASFAYGVHMSLTESTQSAAFMLLMFYIATETLKADS